MNEQPSINSREFLCKDTHDKLCGCGSGTYRSTCQARVAIENPINTSYKYGQVSVLSQVVKSLNCFINQAREAGLDARAEVAEAVKNAIISELDTEDR